MRRARGFTLVELLVSLFALALLAALSWRGLDGMMRARQVTEARADEVLALQTGLAQWGADLDAIASFAPTPAIQWNGRVLRLTRQSSLAPADGVRVVGWTRREGQWRRWESAPVFTRGDLEAAWLQADLWAQNPSDAMRAQEVAITPLLEWQVFYFRENAWTNPQSAATSTTPAAPTSATAIAGQLPDGVRLVLQLPEGRALGGQLQRDWMRPTLTP
ncbi:prepilin-type N-terminal cleavage/methylation domain-containing protein [Ramlibacter sp. USB13]|uniref:Prepilin-type N-terminal cleavage/methylation domain-containing protein n=1 Tax=Ramlibacter cellulosilyticus TaxID=2764187 RepID=A0A923MUM4_9BURK|nr:prepilin-type N-terminal cleavage/methylation domain-containing protein [Ramlibacter cellulosilyticus]MBC5785043.1 prepilin-type N-terminal cleavage/methylation domain-containing protein [Ramlibacter cellulosilyticus]